MYHSVFFLDDDGPFLGKLLLVPHIRLLLELNRNFAMMLVLALLDGSNVGGETIIETLVSAKKGKWING